MGDDKNEQWDRWAPGVAAIQLNSNHVLPCNHLLFLRLVIHYCDMWVCIRPTFI